MAFSLTETFYSVLNASVMDKFGFNQNAVGEDLPKEKMTP